MSQKRAAAYRGTPGDGRCCRQNRHLGVCPHHRVCAWHLVEDARAARAEREADVVADLNRAAQMRRRA